MISTLPKISTGKYRFLGVTIILGMFLLFVAFPGDAFDSKEALARNFETCGCEANCTDHLCCLSGTCQISVPCHCMPTETGNDKTCLLTIQGHEVKEEEYLEEPATDPVEATANSVAANIVRRYIAFPQFPGVIFLEYHCRNSLRSDDDPLSL
jgi:hypothetical protein